MTDRHSQINENIIGHYTMRDEDTRLQRGMGLLEFARAKELLNRHLPGPPAVVLDVGGGSGPYSTWLARKGYEVHLVDAVPKHVDQAQAASDTQPDYPLASVQEGDARRLGREDESCDAVLLMGPLYHLVERSDRVQALREAYRVLRPGGVVFAKAVNRYASLIYGLTSGDIDDPVLAEIIERDLAEGQHRSKDNYTYFTTAFFHMPEELENEVETAGFTIDDLVAVQGPGGLAKDLSQRWESSEQRSQILDLVRKVEHERSLLGVSPHFAVIGHK